jgi:glycosyltransferase involved in cell wall biosynthesis
MVHLNESEVSSLENKKVLFVGRYSKQKGIPDLFRVWELVNQRHPDWQLNLYGGMGEDYEYALAEADRLQTNIRISTETADIFNQYRESSIFVLTSIYEPFGLVLPEAMSYGLPVVSFDCPYGPANIISDGVDGFLIKNRDVNAFADRVCTLIEDTKLRQQMGRAAIMSSKRFAAEKIMPKWKTLFDTLVNDKKH